MIFWSKLKQGLLFIIPFLILMIYQFFNFYLILKFDVEEFGIKLSCGNNQDKIDQI